MGEPFAVRGPTLVLRYPREDDAPALHALASDPEVTRFFSWGPYADPAEARRWIGTLPGRREAGEGLELLVEHRAHGAAGITGFTELAPRDRRATIGSWLGRAFWGTGTNDEAKALVAHLGFRVLGLERITAYAAEGNPRSQRALEKLGWVREGVLRGFHRHGDAVYDIVVFGLLRADWEGSRLAELGSAAEVEGAPPAAWLVNPAAAPS